jgi:hypothetical protein
MLAFKTLRDGARPPDNLSEVRAATVAQLQPLVYESKAFEEQVRLAGDNLSILRSARERGDTARQEESTAAGQYRDVEKLLVDTVEHLARLRRAAPAASNQEAIDELTNKFVLRLPFPRPGQWIRSTVPQHTTYTTDEGIETRSVTEYLPHADPTQTVVVKRTYYAAADAGRLGSAVTPHPLLTQCQRHQEALSIVRELTHADDDEWRDRVTERTELRETSHDDRWSAFSRAAQVSKEVRRIAAPTSLGEERDAELLKYLSLSLPSLFSQATAAAAATTTTTTASSITHPADTPQLLPLQEKPMEAAAGTGLTGTSLKDKLAQNPRDKPMVERAIEGAMNRRLDAWATSFRALQTKLGTAHVPRGATYITISASRVQKFKRTLASLNAKMLEFAGASPPGGGLKKDATAKELLDTYEGLEIDLSVALSHCTAWVEESREARLKAEEAIAACTGVRCFSSSWLTRLQERSDLAEKKRNHWKTTHKEYADWLRKTGGGGEGCVSPGTVARLKAQEKDAQEQMQAALEGVDEVIELARRWSVMVVEICEYVREAPLERLSWSLFSKVLCNEFYIVNITGH